MKKAYRQARRGIYFALLLALALPSAGFGQSSGEGKPLWEVGLFNTAAMLPHYRGSDEYEGYVLPLPYLIYRGKILRANREGVRGVFFDSPHFEMSLSFWGNPPVKGKSDARKGMEDLDAIIEAGPALRWYFSERNAQSPLYLQAALRGACSIAFHNGLDTTYQGLHGNLNLIYQNHRLFKAQKLSFGVNLGVDFADRGFNGYLYDVPPADARPDRPYYDARGGYAGASLSLSLVKRLTDRLSLVLYSRWENVTGATFQDSPLVKQTNDVVLAFGLLWKIAESKRTAQAAESSP
jgi:outer membrane scaffolding protein for murein synthesis (MipA/OmpV family)